MRRIYVWRRLFVLGIAVLLLLMALFAIRGIASAMGQWRGGTEAVTLLADTNRDGVVSKADARDRNQWSWQSGAFILANVDDDDGDGVPDALDTVVNGAADEKDLAIATFTLPRSLLAGETLPTVTVEVNLEARSSVKLFQQVADRWQFVDMTHPALLTMPEGALESEADQPITITLGLESTQFASGNWSGLARLTVRVAQQGRQRAEFSDAIALRVAPWLMLPNSAKTTDLYIGKGFYNNQVMRSQLRRLLPRLDVALHEYSSDHWQDMWTQDMMEIGYQEVPGHPGMHVILQANRGIDVFPQTLLGPDVGYITVGEPRTLPIDDELADWFGNLEVSHPVPGYPMGRIYYGKNTQSNIALHPVVVDFLRRQEMQAPVWLDTSWLLVKHADEVLSFVAAADGQPYLLVNDMTEGIRLLEDLRSQGAGNDPIGTADITVDEAIATYRPLQHPIQRRILDRIIQKAQEEFHIKDDHILRLPAVITDTQNASTLWSNSVNSVFINGTLIMGDPHGPILHGRDLIQDQLRQRLEAIALPIEFVDDTPYQVNHGNVHCATNTKRQTLYPQFWTHLPPSLQAG